MVYKATTNKVVNYFFFLLMMLSIFQIQENYSWMLYYLIPFAIIVLATVFINFTLKLSDGFLTFQILFFTLPIYNKEVKYNQVAGMKFKRVGWAKKCAIIQNHKGFNFRIVNFKPERIYNDLIDFASDYEIPVSKTKDYLILEKLK